MTKRRVFQKDSSGMFRPVDAAFAHIPDEPRDRHPECTCKKPLKSGRKAMGRDICRLCDRLC